MHFHQHEIDQIQSKLQDSLKVIRLYEWLLDAYVLDFYVDCHWERLPASWTQVLADIPPEYLADLLVTPKAATERTVWPLSLLALRSTLQRLCIPRNPREFTKKLNLNRCDTKKNPKVTTILTKKGIKAKKQHEIERMSQLTASIANDLGIKYIVDFGAGLGHLSRQLAYGYGMHVCCLEKEQTLTAQANELDNKMMELIRKFSPDVEFPRPVHLNMCLSKDTSYQELVGQIRKCFNIADDEEFKFGIIGLHPCGDLAAILTNFYLQSPAAKFLNLVGCCYFKITTEMDTHRGYPLSGYLLAVPGNNLSFEAREIACHAIEVYANRLNDRNYEDLRVHSFRATLEKIMCKYWPERKRSGVRSIKRISSFREYCEQAVSHLPDIQIPDHEIDAPDTLMNLERWKCVVIFYTLRLMVAPIVESVILYDRILRLMEHGCSTKIDAIFDPVISARNHIITAIKL